MTIRSCSGMAVARCARAWVACAVTALSALTAAHAQEPPPPPRGESRQSLADEIELAEIRVAIRVQEVEVAKAERRVFAREPEAAAEKLATVQNELKALESQVARLRELQGQGLVDERRMQEAAAKQAIAKANIDAHAAIVAAVAEKLAVHEAKLRVLELQVELERTKLAQLKRRLQRA